jgi:hypothetical protein
MGLAGHFRRDLGYDDVIDRSSWTYRGGFVVGEVVSTATPFVNPCGLATAARWGIWGLNAAQGIGGLFQAHEQWQQGNYLGAALDATGSVFNFLQLFKACFTGDVKLLARGSWGEGWKRIDEIAVGDDVLSRDEHDPAGPLAWKRVEETFERVGMAYELEVTGGRVIPTTMEHPFYVVGKGWTAAGELQPGDQLVGLDSQEHVTVTALRSTGRLEKLYNLRVADYHTYCVGDQGWALNVWAHNADYSPKLIQRTGINITEHALARLQGRLPRGVTQEAVLKAYNHGRLYYDPLSKKYIRYDPQTQVAVVVTNPSRGRIWTVFEGMPSSRWQHVRWRPG